MQVTVDPVPVLQVIDWLLTRLDHVPGMRPQPDRAPSRTGTGVCELDQVLGGGLGVGEVVLVAADDQTLAHSITGAVTRWCPVPLLAAVTDPVAAGRRLLAAEAYVPERGLRHGHLSEGQWNRVAGAVSRICVLDLQYTPAADLQALGVACTGEWPLLIVESAEHLGQLPGVLEGLSRLARARSVAVLAVTTARALDAQEAAGSARRVIAVASCREPGHATVLDTDSLAVTTAPTDASTTSFGSTDTTPA